MSKRKKGQDSGAMLDQWRPPQGAGDPIGCLATTYTFAPGLFDEQCLARFLEIESEPNREDLAFLLERESRLGSVYAGVLVDHTQGGVEHSLRWDVLRVRIPSGKQHAKLGLLVWSRHVRIIISSANLTEPGYRSNYEVAAAVDLSPSGADADLLAEAIRFLRRLVLHVPGASENPPEVLRAEVFLKQVEQLTKGWKNAWRGGAVRQELVFTAPALKGHPARSSLVEAVEACRRRGASPHQAWIASPFYDVNDESGHVVAALCKLMTRSYWPELSFCVLGLNGERKGGPPRLAAPEALLKTPEAHNGTVTIRLLPEQDEDKNLRQWHAKMLALRADKYSALMVGSSNFTCAGMGASSYRNAEANLVTIVDRVAHGREVGEIEAVWPEMKLVSDPEDAEWLGAQPEKEEEEKSAAQAVPAGFLSATYRAGDERRIVLRLDPEHLPREWQICGCGRDNPELLSANTWRESGSASVVEVPWVAVQPPEKLLVRWEEQEAFLPLNVEDSRCLPPPAQLEKMTADDMLLILAASDPSAAFRIWAKHQKLPDDFDPDLDSGTPIDLDPLRRHDLEATFLHRVRRRARVLAQLRSNLQKPVCGRQTLEWRCRGLIGIEPLAERLVRDFENANDTDEALLTLADFMIVLREVDYETEDGALPKREFDAIYRPFLRELAGGLGRRVSAQRDRVSAEMREFWERVVKQCQS